MNTNCLNCDQPSPTFKDRTDNLGKTFVYTVLAFLVLCVVSYVVHA